MGGGWQEVPPSLLPSFNPLLYLPTAVTAPSAAPTRGKEPAGGPSSTWFCPAEEVRVSKLQQLPQFSFCLFGFLHECEK